VHLVGIYIVEHNHHFSRQKALLIIEFEGIQPCSQQSSTILYPFQIDPSIYAYVTQDLFSSDFLTINLYSFLISPLRPTRNVHFIFLNFPVTWICGAAIYYCLQIFDVYNYFISLGPNILLGALLSKSLIHFAYMYKQKMDKTICTWLV